MIHMQRKVQQAYDAQKFVLYMLLSLIYVSFICIQLGSIQAITDFSFTLHELLYFPANLALFVGPPLFILYVVLLAKYWKVRERKKPSRKSILSFAAVVLSLLMVGSITVYEFGKITTAGFFKIEHKLQEDDDYYIYISETKLKVSQADYELVDTNQEYFIQYVWHELTPDVGKILEIEPVN